MEYQSGRVAVSEVADCFGGGGAIRSGNESLRRGCRQRGKRALVAGDPGAPFHSTNFKSSRIELPTVLLART